MEPDKKQQNDVLVCARGWCSKLLRLRPTVYSGSAVGASIQMFDREMFWIGVRPASIGRCSGFVKRCLPKCILNDGFVNN